MILQQNVHPPIGINKGADEVKLGLAVYTGEVATLFVTVLLGGREALHPVDKLVAAIGCLEVEVTRTALCV